MVGEAMQIRAALIQVPEYSASETLTKSEWKTLRRKSRTSTIHGFIPLAYLWDDGRQCPLVGCFARFGDRICSERRLSPYRLLHLLRV
jgi:hypothetical protein